VELEICERLETGGFIFPKIRHLGPVLETVFDITKFAKEVESRVIQGRFRVYGVLAQVNVSV
jgi:hypothetical protein